MDRSIASLLKSVDWTDKDAIRVRKWVLCGETQLNRKSRYGDYLKSKRWSITRKKVMKLVGNICEVCDTDKATQVHHMDYSYMGRERVKDLIPICDLCHTQFNGTKSLTIDVKQLQIKINAKRIDIFGKCDKSWIDIVEKRNKPHDWKDVAREIKKTGILPNSRPAGMPRTEWKNLSMTIKNTHSIQPKPSKKKKQKLTVTRNLKYKEVWGIMVPI